MAKLFYCWKCKADVPMLEDAEWAEVAPHMTAAIQAIKNFRIDHNASLQETLKPNSGLKCQALDLYFKFTGVKESDPNKLRHHHISFFGPACPGCGKLLRTPNARFCAACGMHVVKA